MMLFTRPLLDEDEAMLIAEIAQRYALGRRLYLIITDT